jgi:hypothetical protein
MAARGWIAIAALLSASACAQEPVPASVTLAMMGASDENLAEQCLQDADAPGAYMLDETVAPVQFSPDEGAGGTQEGAQMLNACMRQAWGVMLEAEALETAAHDLDLAPAPDETEGLPDENTLEVTCPPGFKGLFRGNMLC